MYVRYLRPAIRNFIVRKSIYWLIDNYEEIILARFKNTSVATVSISSDRQSKFRDSLRYYDLITTTIRSRASDESYYFIFFHPKVIWKIYKIRRCWRLLLHCVIMFFFYLYTICMHTTQYARVIKYLILKHKMITYRIPNDRFMFVQSQYYKIHNNIISYDKWK